MKFRVDRGAPLAAGAAKREITPPLEAGLLMSSVESRWAPFVAVRKPLFARALVVQSESPDRPREATQRVAIVGLDLLALSGKALSGFDSFKSRIVEASRGAVTAEQVLLACTHTHTAPESGGITDLYRTAPFRRWVDDLAAGIGQALASAVARIAPCHLSYGRAQAPGLGIHRRLKTTGGIMMSHPEPPEDVVVSRAGATDDTVNVLWLRDREDVVVAAIVNATCHPVYEMCNPQVSPDYPGELCERIEQEHPGCTALFLNGAAGNINPRGVSSGAAAAEQHAEHLVAAVRRAASVAKVDAAADVALLRRDCRLPTRLPHGEDCGQQALARLAALRLGDAALIFLPGEPFVETGKALRAASPFGWTSVVGCAEETVGYIPTDEAFSAGGYETEFGPWSILSPGSEAALRRAAAGMLNELSRLRESAERLVPHAFGGASGAGEGSARVNVNQGANDE